MINVGRKIWLGVMLASVGMVWSPAARAQMARQDEFTATQDAVATPVGRDSEDDALKVRRLRDMMREHLHLDEEQQEPINAIFEEHIERLLSARMERDDSEDRTAVLADIREELEAARKSQDRDAVVELMRELREAARGNTVDYSMHAAFRDEVVAELDDEQAEKFRFMFEHIFGAGQAAGSAPLGARQQTHFMWRSLFQLGLEHEQRETIREMFNEYHGDTMRQAAADEEEQLDSAPDRALDTDRVAELRERILDLLTDEQIERFEQIEADMIKDKASLQNIAYDRANDRPFPGSEPKRFRVKQQKASPQDDYESDEDAEMDVGDDEDDDEEWTDSEPN